MIRQLFVQIIYTNIKNNETMGNINVDLFKQYVEKHGINMSSTFGVSSISPGKASTPSPTIAAYSMELVRRLNDVQCPYCAIQFMIFELENSGNLQSNGTCTCPECKNQYLVE